jgi:hypothetical protein
MINHNTHLEPTPLLACTANQPPHVASSTPVTIVAHKYAPSRCQTQPHAVKLATLRTLHTWWHCNRDTGAWRIPPQHAKSRTTRNTTETIIRRDADKSQNGEAEGIKDM